MNSGTVWAGVAFYAGWKLARPLQAFIGGIAAAVATLLIHYVVGGVLGFVAGRLIILSGSNDLIGNLDWFLVALMLCGPLGLAGWLAARTGWAAVLARFIVPVGALVEPFFLGKFTNPYYERPWAERYSDYVSGVALIVLGIAGIIYVCWKAVRARTHVSDSASNDDAHGFVMMDRKH
ncbi:MAG: hypothetical protein ACRDAX_05695 [Propionibacteriaceae bacterium]